MTVGGLQTGRETVDAALRELLQRRQRREALEAFGTIDLDPEYDHKLARSTLVDTSVWSMTFRRTSGETSGHPAVAELRTLIERD